MRETERRLAGDVLAEALAGRPRRRRSCAGRLRPFGIGERGGGARLRAGRPGGGRGRAASAALAAAGCPGAGRGHSAAAATLLCAVIDADGGDPVEIAARRPRASSRPTHGAGARRGQPGGGARRAAPQPSTRRAARSRRPRSPNGDAPEVASYARPRRLHAAAVAAGRRGAARSTATASSARSRRATASTAASCCARSRRSSSTTASGSGPPASSTATATRCATGSARSRS